MQETKGARDEEENIVKEDTMNPSEDGSGTGSQVSEPSIKGQETELISITTSPVSEVAQESERGFSGFDLNEEFSSEEKPECSLSGAHSNSKPRSVCLDIDLNVADDNGEESSVVASPWKPSMLHLDLNTCQSMSQLCSSSSSSSSMKSFDLNFNSNDQNGFISLFGTQVEVNSRGTGSSLIGRILEPRRVPMTPQFAPPFFMNMVGGGGCFGPTGDGPLQQHMGLNLSLVGGKRKEPVGGWEGFPVEYKHQQPRWK